MEMGWYHKMEEERKIERKKRRKERKEEVIKGLREVDPRKVQLGRESIKRVLSTEEEPVEFRIQVRIPIVDMANLAVGLESARETAALKNLTTFTQAAFKLAIRALMDKEEEITDMEDALQVLEDMRIIDVDSTSLTGGALRRNRVRRARGEIETEMLQERTRSTSRGRERGITEEEIQNFDPVKYGERLSKIKPDPSLEAHAKAEMDRMKREMEAERKRQALREELEDSEKNPKGLFPSPRTDLKDGEADVTFEE
jgi:hypothetical protein